MDTRTERINEHVYCAYCGKELIGYSIMISPRPFPAICDCEKAKEELNLCNKLTDLYNTPLPDNLIDKKVQEYRNKLLGGKAPIFTYL